jgi:diacylglycerol kinase family enzyme
VIRVFRRIAAVLTLLSLGLGLLLLVMAGLRSFPRGVIALVLVVLALAVAWQGLIRRGRPRVVSWIVAGILVVGAVGGLVIDGILIEGVLGLGLVVLSVMLGKRAFSVHLHLPPAPPPQRAVVVWNPRSGGGKALKWNLADEARRRGIEPIELTPGADLVTLVQDAVRRGADGLMAAGGDGTQALVATIAAEHDLPFACIPAGTRNHFALDLGVDRDDVVGALDAFVSGGEKRVDLGEVSGRTFVNNVSLGLYAEAVQRDGYRDAKIRTILDTVPTMLSGDTTTASGDDGSRASRELRWTGPDGRPERSAAVVLVSNNVYRLGRVIGSGTRPRMDAGVLGVTVIGAVVPGVRRRSVKSEWPTTEFTIESDGDVPVGVDGEALVLPSPLMFRTRPGALRVRIAPQHPGASPSAAQPTGLRDAVRRLVRIASGTDPIAAGPARA